MRASAAILIAVAVVLFVADLAYCNPAIANSYDFMSICIENCAQCQKMWGKWFKGEVCADECLKFKGRMLPVNCEDGDSIKPYLNNL